MPADGSMHLTVSFVQDCTKKIILAVFFSAVLLSGTAAGQQTLKNGIDEMVGQTVPRDLIFFDEKGGKVSLRQLTDKPALISFVYFSCSSRCPLLLGNLAETLGKTDIKPDDYRVINYLKATGRPFPGTTWRFLTGDKKNIAELTRAVGFTFREEKNGFLHPRALVFLSPGGTVSRYLYGMSFSPFDIRMALKEASAGSSFFNADRLSLFCFSYDPEENKYVFNLARSLAAVLFLAMISSLAVFLMVRRNERER
jgi:protein SCO1/2